jgi:hypothetical protein
MSTSSDPHHRLIIIVSPKIPKSISIVLMKHLFYYLYFVDPQTRVQKNSIESMIINFNVVKDKNKGVNRDYLQKYFDKFCWRHNNQVGRTGACGKL